jgi:hypothetical protein
MKDKSLKTAEEYARAAQSHLSNRMGDGNIYINIVSNRDVSKSNRQGLESHSIRTIDKSQDYSLSGGKNDEDKATDSKAKAASCSTLYIEALIDYHVLLAPVLKRSIMDPLWLRMLNLFLYLTIIFGISALVFADNFIDQRMADNDRDEILYPIKNEFARLILSLVYGLILFNVIKYAFKTVPSDTQKYIKEALEFGDKQVVEEAKYIAFNFRKHFRSRMMMRFVLYLIITVAIFLTLWYYMTVFCSVYYTARKGWIYGAITIILLDLCGLSFVISGMIAIIKRIIFK